MYNVRICVIAIVIASAACRAIATAKFARHPEWDHVGHVVPSRVGNELSRQCGNFETL